ncbi:MAG: hypothetical protein VKN72_03755 [Nostocales cyanobacterium 94392]|nr:hypothetical protein [Nostocales cyanobacterium 94392]
MRYIPSKLLSFPLLLTCAIFLTAITSHSYSLLFSLLIGSLLMIAIQVYGEFRQSSQYVISVIQTVVIVILLSIFWLDYFSTPAAAQFFGKAENFFKNTLTQGSQGGANDAVSLVFNVLRALYLLYIAMALIGVINAVRKDEDWQVVARTPLLVVIAVTIADVLTSFVIG